MLLDIVKKYTIHEPNVLPADHPLNGRLIQPQYSRTAVEVKTYPLLESERIFVTFILMTGRYVRATMYPAPTRYVIRRPYVQGTETQPHTHDYIELGYVASGPFRQIIMGKTITFRTGDLILIDKNCIHQDILDDGACMLFFGISNTLFAEIINEGYADEKITRFLQEALVTRKNLQQFLHFRRINTNVTPSSPSSDEEDQSSSRDMETFPIFKNKQKKSSSEAAVQNELEICLTQLVVELLDDKPGTAYIRKGLLMRLLRILSTEYDFSLSRDQKAAVRGMVYDGVLDYIRSHLASVTVKDLCREFHFQEDYFNRIIRENTGMTYSAYVQKLRLEKAAALLTGDKSLSVSDIAEEVGYNNRGFFYQLFKEAYGMTPAEYRVRNSV